MTVKEIKKILSNTAYKDAEVYSYKHLTGGLMNTIWKVDTSLGRIIIKIYDIKRNLKTANKSMEIWKNFVSVPEPIHKCNIIYNDKQVFVYRYITGEELSRPNHYQLEQILNIIKATNQKITSIDNDDIIKTNITEKQYNDLINLKQTKIDNKIVKEVCDAYEKIRDKIIKNSKYIGHHDLNYGNILWSYNELFGIIDFDEASICTKEYELVVFATKHCMIEDNFDIYYLYEILKLYYGEINNKILNEYRDSFLFYTLKVLLEKFYLYQYDIIDVYDKRQIKDNWNWWYKLFKSVDKIIEEIRKNI